MESGSVTQARTAATVPRVLGILSFVLALLGMTLSCLFAFGLLALPLLPHGMYSYVGLHSLDLLALVVGSPGPLVAALALGLAVWARIAGARSHSSTRLATTALVLTTVALALAALAWAGNANVADHGSVL